MRQTKPHLAILVRRATNMTLATAVISSLMLFSAHARAADESAKAPSFETLDLNQDQFIDAKEAQALPALAAAFTAADTDKDGKLSPAEFAAIAGKLNG